MAAGPVCWILAVVIGAALPDGPFVSQSSGQGPPVRVGLLQGAIHTDFLLPLDKATRRDFATLDLPETARWLAVGWGAREFYTTVGGYREVSRSALWRAIKGDRAVMRFEPFGEYTPELSIELDSLEYERLRKSILSDTDFAQPVGAGLLRAGDRYFAAQGNFNAINTCNQWISRSLKRAGRRFGLWTQTTWAVRLSLAVYR